MIKTVFKYIDGDTIRTPVTEIVGRSGVYVTVEKDGTGAFETGKITLELDQDVLDLLQILNDEIL